MNITILLKQHSQDNPKLLLPVCALEMQLYRDILFFAGGIMN